MSTVNSIISSATSDVDKIRAIKDLVSNDHQLIRTIPDDFNTNERSKSFSMLLILLKIELLLISDEFDPSIIATYLKQVQSLLPKNSTNTTSNSDLTYLKLKYDDLYTDFQLLYPPKYMDLVNKKLILLNNMHNNQQNILEWTPELLQLVVDIYHKTTECLLLTGNEFLKNNILQHLQKILNENDPISHEFNKSISPTTSFFFDRNIRKQCVSWQQFEEFLRHAHTPWIRKLALKQPLPHTLLCNQLENNISLLSKYYLNISLSKIKSLFEVPDSIDIEDLVATMVIKDKLPPHSQIDQIKSVLYFGGDTEVYNPENQHVKDICLLVDEIVTLIGE
ncbi:hypothetical protein CAAN1_08S03136 [[Candida] anglica]|uniref:PCI domain-containing protein n=1 Tax=[Candida] anglica TaxID=148631 RepID=A0ABP0E7R8_9ASCO